METILLEFAKEAILAPVVIWAMYQLDKRRQEDIKARDDDKKMVKEMINEIKKSVGKTVVTDNQAIQIGRSMVKAASLDKLKFIRARLEKNNLAIRKDKIKEHITAELKRQSSIYVDELNEYCVNGFVRLGDLIAETFDMDSFLEEVFDTVFNTELNLDRKLIDIETTMMSYQNSMWGEIRAYLNKG